MAENTLSSSNIFLSIVCALIVVSSFVFNFTFIITLLKQRRLNAIDKSNFFLTHLILADFLCCFFIVVPSGYGVYNNNSLGKNGCSAQTYFTTFFFSITFIGLFALSIERYIKYKNPIYHANFFTRRLHFDEYERLLNDATCHPTYTFIIGIWLLCAFISFIPMFANYGQLQYFSTQSQCDYTYETFNWWIWLFFLLFMTFPFIGSLILFSLTFRLIKKAERIVKMRKSQFDLDDSRNKKRLSNDKAEDFVEGVDLVLQPANLVYYSHLINEDDLAGEDETNKNHIRNQLLAQFKYDTEKSKCVSFFIILVLNYCMVFPLFVIHFYRMYNNTKKADDVNGFDNPSLISGKTYTAFVWITYLTLFLKSFVCLVQNRFYRHALYQAANVRGFSGAFDFQKEVNKMKQIFNLEDSDTNIQSKA